MMRGRKGPSWSVDIDAPRDKVFEYVLDFSRHPEWGMDDMVIKGPEGPAREGYMYDAEGTLRGKRNASTLFVSDVHAPDTIEFEAQDASGIVGHVFSFEPTNGSTHVTRTMYGIKQGALAPLLYVFFRGAINKNFDGALQNLKRKMEQG